MTDYEATCTTNPFRVRSIDALRDALEQEGFRVVTDVSEFGHSFDAVLLHVRNESANEVSLYAGGENGMWPDLYDCETEEEGGGLDGVVAAVTQSLSEDSIAIFTEVGSDHDWDLVGYSVAVSASGECIRMNLSDVVEMARERFAGVTVRA